MRRPAGNLFVGAAVGGALLLSACAGSDPAVAGSSTTEADRPTATSTSVPHPSTTETTTPPVPRPTVEIFSDVSATVFIPTGEPPFPAVVAIHGGGYTNGHPGDMGSLSAFMRDQGFLVFNTGYQLATRKDPSFPEAIHDVACAVRLAASHELSDGTVAVLGVSSGAHFAALLAVTGDRYGTPCPESEPVIPDRLLALGIPEVMPHPFLNTFIGADSEKNPEAWNAVDPLQYVGNNPDLQALFIHAGNDEVLSSSGAVRMTEGLNEAGTEAAFIEVPGIGHLDLHNPTHVGEVIADWLQP